MVNTVLSKIPEQMIAWNSYWEVKKKSKGYIGFFLFFFFWGGGGSVLILSSTDYSHTYG